MLDLVVLTILSSIIFFQILIIFFDKMLNPFCAIVPFDNLSYVFVSISVDDMLTLSWGFKILITSLDSRLKRSVLDPTHC